MVRNRAILTEKVWSITDLLCGKRTLSANGTQQVTPSERNSRATLHAREVNQSAVFGSFIPLAEPGSRVVNTSSREPLNFT